MKIRWVFLCLMVHGLVYGLGNERIPNFVQAKKLALEVFDSHTRTIYCNCPYSSEGIDYSDCSFIPQKDMQRAHRMEWEHVVPASEFGHTFKEWTQGHPSCVSKGKHFKGRKCAERASKVFSHIASDLYNLYPSVGEVNGIRENFKIGEIEGEEREFGECDFEVRNGIVEPGDNAKGKVARVYLYMDASYPGRQILDETMKRLVQRWDDEFPVEEGECERYQRIWKIQGNDNPILHDRCERAGLL